MPPRTPLDADDAVAGVELCSVWPAGRTVLADGTVDPGDPVVSVEDWRSLHVLLAAADTPDQPEPSAGDADGVDAAGPVRRLADRVTALGALVDGLIAEARAAACCLSGAELLGVLGAVESVRRRLPAIDHVLVGQADSRGLCHDFGQPSTARWLTGELALRPGEAVARVAAARAFGERASLGGEPLEPVRPLVAAAQQRGELSADHAAVIDATLRRLPPDCDPAVVAELEATLVRHAGVLDPATVARLGRHAVALLDPDGVEPAERRLDRLRGLTMIGRDDGSGRLAGELTPECLAVLRAVLDPLAAPRPTDDLGPDPRRAEQRMHDALLDAGKRLLRSGTLPDAGGVPTTVVVTFPADQLATRTGFGTTAHGGSWAVDRILRGLDDCEFVSVLRDAQDGVLAYGSTRRYATPAQTKALIARDQGCSFPRCSVPAGWCQRHHIRPVIDGGLTDLNNLTLVCGYHHRRFHQAGWNCLMIDGRPHWRPPAWIDAERRPRPNTHWTTTPLE